MKPIKRRLNFGELIVPGIALVFGILYLVQTTDAPAVAIRWPYAVIGITTVFWLAVVARNTFTWGTKTPTESSVNLSRPIMMIAAPVGYLMALPFLGFSISSCLFLTVLFRLLGGTSWRSNVITAFLMSLFLHIMLITFLDMSLPRLEIMGFLI